MRRRDVMDGRPFKGRPEGLRYCCSLLSLDGRAPFRVVTRTLHLGKVDAEGAALSGRAFDGDGAAVCFDDGFDEAEAKAEPALGSAQVAAEEPFPDARQLGWRNADAGVMHA